MYTSKTYLHIALIAMISTPYLEQYIINEIRIKSAILDHFLNLSESR